MQKLFYIILCFVAVLVATNCGNKNVQQHNTEPISNEWSADSADTLQRVVTEFDSVENSRLLDSLAVAKADSIELAEFWEHVGRIRAEFNDSTIIYSLIHLCESDSFVNTTKVTAEDFALIYSFEVISAFHQDLCEWIYDLEGKLISERPVIADGIVHFLKIIYKYDEALSTELRDSFLHAICWSAGFYFDDKDPKFRGSQEGYDYIFYRIPESFMALYDLPREREIIIDNIMSNLSVYPDSIKWTDTRI